MEILKAPAVVGIIAWIIVALIRAAKGSEQEHKEYELRCSEEWKQMVEEWQRKRADGDKERPESQAGLPAEHPLPPA